MEFPMNKNKLRELRVFRYDQQKEEPHLEN